MSIKEDLTVLSKRIAYLGESPKEENVFSLLFDGLLENESVGFIQLGAYNGTGDLFQEKFLWPENRFQFHGLLVEPNPIAFRQLKSLVASIPERSGFLECLNHAVHPVGGGYLDFYTIRESRILDEWRPEVFEKHHINVETFRRVSSVYRSHVVNHMAAYRTDAVEDCEAEVFFDRYIGKISVSTISPAQLRTAFSSIAGRIDEAGTEHSDSHNIDFLLIDVEGLDLDVLRSFFTSNILPTVILYEDVHLDRDQATALLKEFNYQNFNLYGYNSIAIAQSVV